MWDRIAEQKIREAQREGLFDNLKGAGKPIDLNEDPLEDPAYRIARSILGDSGFTLPWIEEGKDIDQGLRQARLKLRRAHRRYQDAPADGEGRAWADVRWKQEVSAFREECAELNRRILTLNLQVPAMRFQRSAIRVEKELEQITAGGEG